MEEYLNGIPWPSARAKSVPPLGIPPKVRLKVAEVLPLANQVNFFRPWQKNPPRKSGK